MNKSILLLSTAFIIAISGYFLFQNNTDGSENSEGMMNPQLRDAWEHRLLEDPETGLIPVSRAQELAFAS